MDTPVENRGSLTTKLEFISDVGPEVLPHVRGSKARFFRKKHLTEKRFVYIALNRAARRFLQSTKARRLEESGVLRISKGFEYFS